MTTMTETPPIDLSLRRPRVDPLKLRITGTRLLIQRLEADEKTEGGIFVPESARNNADGKQTVLVRVLKVGSGRINEAGVRIMVDGISVNDYVLIGKFSGVPVGKDENIRIINDGEILGIQDLE